MKNKKSLVLCSAGILFAAILFQACNDPVEKYQLDVAVFPEEVAVVEGQGVYESGTVVRINANKDHQQYELVNWINSLGEQLAETLSFDFVMPDHEETLTANFSINFRVAGMGIADADSNTYATVIIGQQEWMAENLRTTKYRDGSPIISSLSNTDWMGTTEGAYAVFDYNHQDAVGINSMEAMVGVYGKLYNWFAVNDPRGICPPGWRVPAYSDWQAMISYVSANYQILNENETNGMGNAFKAALQVEHPWGSAYRTNEHPRWNEHRFHYGQDVFGFSALPAGYRNFDGGYQLLGYPAFFWTSTESNAVYAWYFYINTNMGSINENNRHKTLGLSIRCIKD